MPAISADTMVLPRIPEPDQAAADRPVLSVTTAPSGLEGEGFPVRRAFAGVDLAALDPFVHMDQMGEVDYAPGEPKGTPWHPHRGFETVTYMLDGFLRHQDYDEVFDQLEYLLGMVYAHVRGDGAAPIGRFVWRRQRSGAPVPDEPLATHTGALLAAGLLDAQAETLDATKVAYDQFVRSSGLHF
jgi:hypothetical protein